MEDLIIPPCDFSKVIQKLRNFFLAKGFVSMIWFLRSWIRCIR